MPRQAIDLEPFKAQIIALFNSGSSCQSIQQRLHDRHSIDVSERTINNRLRDWGHWQSQTRYDRTSMHDNALKERIRALFFEAGLEERDLLRTLQREGWNIKPRTLRCLRTSLGLVRRTNDPITRQAQVLEVREDLINSIENGQTEGYGRGFLHQYIRQQGHVITRDRLFQVYKDISPLSVRRRLLNMQRHKGAYIVPGPNKIWSIDGYLKLANYGIEIYAAIDTYSRYVIWIYIGISARTAVSVLHQFLDTLSSTKAMPEIIRSDRGTETVLISSAQHRLRQVLAPDLSFADCYIYGTSTANVRIESWWETWNYHKIRKQPKRPYLPVGKPFINYYHPPDLVSDYSISVDQELLKALQKEVQQFNPDQYLPDETNTWVSQQLSELEFDPTAFQNSNYHDRFAPYHTTYMELRRRVQNHINLGDKPILRLLENMVIYQTAIPSNLLSVYTADT
ncbi:hypothetical protein EYB25_004801 [Talaromyces marneffei]|nr:hypothetical protein EYB25_004801 [Talaromyces marneffei]